MMVWGPEREYQLKDVVKYIPFVVELMKIKIDSCIVVASFALVAYDV